MKFATSLLKHALIGVICVMLTLGQVGCTASDVVINILGEITTASSFVCPIVILADPGAGTSCTQAQSVFAGANAAVQKAYADWKTASVAEQPGKLAALQTFISTLQADLVSLTQAAQVKNVVHQQAIDGILSGILDMVGQIAGFAGQTQSGGGTVAAALAPRASVKAVKALHNAKYFHKEVRSHLTHKTGDAVLDAKLAEFAKTWN